jgi:rubrerythrin
MKNIVALLVLSLFVGSMCIAADKTPPTKTIEDIKAAITGETTASAKYAAYAQKAREEGYSQVAMLFEAASKAEKIHANNHEAVLEQMGEKMGEITPKYEVKTTKENLKDAIKGESYEASTMYPNFIKTANTAKASLALVSFNYAYKTELKHKELYTKALEALEAGTEKTLTSRYYVCPVCGNTYASEASARCGFCMTPKERFITI